MSESPISGTSVRPSIATMRANFLWIHDPASIGSSFDEAQACMEGNVPPERVAELRAATERALAFMIETQCGVPWYMSHRKAMC